MKHYFYIILFFCIWCNLYLSFISTNVTNYYSLFQVYILSMQTTFSIRKTVINFVTCFAFHIHLFWDSLCILLIYFLKRVIYPLRPPPGTGRNRKKLLLLIILCYLQVNHTVTYVRMIMVILVVCLLTNYQIKISSIS